VENGTIVFRAFQEPSFPRPASITSNSQAAIFTEADSARDSIQLRQAQGRTAKLENDIRRIHPGKAILSVGF
jgi:hypothetical protein